MNTETLKIRKPDDFHCHLRRGEVLASVAQFTAQQFRRAVAMPNTIPPIETAEDAEAYRKEITGVCGAGFEPIMAIMLTRRTTPKIVSEAGKHGVKILKYIPRGVSVNSEESIALKELPTFYPVLKAVQEAGMIFSGHWESLLDHDGRQLPEIDREPMAIFFLDAVVRAFPELKIVIEHASTESMIEYVKYRYPKNVGVTLTVHHALLTYDDVCDAAGNIINPHNYCKPIAKRRFDMEAVVDAMTSGDPRFFFGSDNAPHPLSAKKKIPPTAGIFNPFALPLLAQIFEERNALSQLENFVSKFGADFYGLPLNSGTIELIMKSWTVPEEYSGIVPFMAGQTLLWQVAS